jgi:hypothetical protein
MSEEQKQETDSGGPTVQAGWLARLRGPRLPLYLLGAVVVVLGLSVVAVYVWKAVAVRGLEERLAAERSALSSAQREALTVQARDLLRLTARPLAWAVRAEMLRGNLGQVDDYFREFVRERGVTSLMLVGKDGRIALATNRKLETQAADGLVSRELLAAADVAVAESGTSMRMVVPVMGFDSRLGTLVIDFDTQGR